ncbi:MAG TPA: polysaccharide biosynthesis C-terminal domain-containing protein [Tepidiformaceae bacterium]|nr:polysaccharide biosynthesis C-terminal domain-containing protein [Tepidiformaceae bacterium]
MSIAYGSIIAFLFRGMNILIALATVVVTSNSLGVDGRGVFVLGATAVGIVTAVSGGLTAAVAYQVANQRRAPGDVLVNGELIAGSVGIAAIVIGIAGGSVFAGEASRVSLAVGAASAAVIVNGVLAGVYLGDDSLVRYNMALVGPPLLALIGIVGVIFIGGHRTPQAALGAYAIGQWAATPILLALGGWRMVVSGFSFERALTRRLVTFAVVAGLSSAISYLNYRADTFVVDHFRGQSGVAVYSNAAYIAESLWQFSGSIALAAYARLGALNRSEAAELTTRVMRHTAVVLVVVCTGLFIFANVIVDILFAPEYHAMASAMRILLPGTLLYGMAAAFSGYFVYNRGKPWISAVVAGIGLIVDMILCFALIPSLGVNGAATASAVAYAVAMVGALIVFVYDTRLSPGRIFRFTRADLDDYRVLITRVRAAVARRSAFSSQ